MKCKCGKQKDKRAKTCRICHLTKLGKSKIGKPSPIKGKYRVVTLHICEQCNKEFYPHDQSKKNRFCSAGCYRQWRKDVARNLNTPRSTLAYQRWRNAILKRADGKCEACGSKHKLIAHHVVSLKEKPERIYDVSNGQILCYSCHSKVHDFITHLQ